MHRYGENYRDVFRGISLGCPLSPLMVALFLKPLDDARRDSGLFYVRFMDDWIVIAPTRWKLRRAVRRVNEVLAALKMEKHPDKTFIGRARRGFSFLGYYLTPWGISVAQATVDNMKERIARLYEQGADAVSIGQYLRRWQRWAVAGINNWVGDDFFRTQKKAEVIIPLPFTKLFYTPIRRSNFFSPSYTRSC